MALQPWPHIGDEVLAQYKVFDVRRATRRSPRTGAERGFFLVDTPDWVNIVALTERDELILVRQFRHGTREFSLEIPGGLIDSGESRPEQAAARELREETGYAPAELRHIGTMTPNPAFLTNRLHTFLATGCRRVGELVQDPGEDLEVCLVPFAEVDELVRRGQIHHALVLAGLYYARVDRD